MQKWIASLRLRVGREPITEICLACMRLFPFYSHPFWPTLARGNVTPSTEQAFSASSALEKPSLGCAPMRLSHPVIWGSDGAGGTLGGNGRILALAGLILEYEAIFIETMGSLRRTMPGRRESRSLHAGDDGWRRWLVSSLG
jgi:hypothetical protein